MRGKRTFLWSSGLSVVVVAAALAAGCADEARDDLRSDHVTSDSLRGKRHSPKQRWRGWMSKWRPKSHWHAPKGPGHPPPPTGTSPPLVPPAPFVLAPDGVTRLNLEEASILRPGGERWAVVLGKALFWDQQVGSDGQACASCHFHAGADIRITNQLNPGILDITVGPNGDHTFGSTRSDTGEVQPGHMPSGNLAGPNYTVVPEDMPMHQLSDESDRNSPIRTTTNDRFGSQGVFAAEFEQVRPGGRDDGCSPADASVYHLGRFATRQAEPRHAPSFHNAAFNFRQFWDNRGNNLFNGVGVFGMRDIEGNPDARLVVSDRGRPTLGFLQVENASLASQSLAPPPNEIEMSCRGRGFPDIGRKLLSTLPLARQQVSRSDSVLGAYVGHHGRGLSHRYDYAELIKKAFDAKYWSLAGRYRIEDGRLVKNRRGYTQMELNFSMFWGLALAAYQSTVISDQSEFDTLQAQGRLVMTTSFVPGEGECSSPTGDVDPLLVRGCTIFSRVSFGEGAPPPADGVRGGNCFACHNAQAGGAGLARQPMLAEGAIQEGEEFVPFLTVPDVNGINDLRDQGSANIGLRPVFSDRMSGGTDPYGNPLSFGRQLWNYLDGKPGAIVDPPIARAIAAGAFPARIGLDGPGPDPADTFRKLETDGSTKAPILRNLALTPPYFSWGGYHTIREVMKVYNRGMNRRDITGQGSPDAHGSHCATGDDTGSGPDGNQRYPITGPDCGTNTTGFIHALELSDCDANGTPNATCVEQGHTVKNDDLAALERFFKSLTDPRVQCDVAPFDHPELELMVGHRIPRYHSKSRREGRADDLTFALPAVGREGYSPRSGYCIPNAGDLFAPGMQARVGGKRVPLR